MVQPVVVHEFGHSFAGLADEYAYEDEAIPMYPHDVEPWESNITTLVDFKGKWENLIKPGTPIPTPLSRKAKAVITQRPHLSVSPPKQAKAAKSFQTARQE